MWVVGLGRSISKLQRDFWVRIGRSNFVLRQIGRFSTLCVLVASIALISVVDLFGFSSSTQAISQEITQRIVAPWYGLRKGAERTPTQPSTVVLMRPDNFDNWPPSYEEQLEVLKPIIAHCPRVIAIDLLYQYYRGQETTFEEFLLELAEALDEAQANECGRGIPVIFGDTRSNHPGADLLEELGHFAEDPIEAAQHLCEQLRKLRQPQPPQRPFLELLAQQDDHEPQGEPELDDDASPYCSKIQNPASGQGLQSLQIALGVIQWEPVESDTASCYYGADYTRFYGLLSPIRDDGPGGAARPRPLDTAATGCRAHGGRPSLAMQSFLAWCGNAGTCPDANIEREGSLRFGQNATVERRNQPLEAAAIRPYLAPIEIQWPVWGPSTNLFLWQGFDLPTDRHFLASMLGRGTCGFEKPPKGFQHIGVSALESMRLLASSLPGSAPAARDEARTPCFPLTAINAQTQIVRIFCEFCAPEPHPRDSDLEPGSGTWNAIIDRIDKWQALADQEDGIPKLLTDRAVFVGALDLAGADVIHSPVHDALPGVFRHAMVFDNLTRWGQEIFTLPPSRDYMVLGFPIGQTLLAETAVAILLLLVVLILRHRGFHRAAWERLDAEVQTPIPLKTGQMAGKVLCACWLQVLGVFYVVLIVLAVSIGVTIAKFAWLNHTSFNWFGVSTLSIMPALLFPHVQRAMGFQRGIRVKRPPRLQLPASSVGGPPDP